LQTLAAERKNQMNGLVQVRALCVVLGMCLGLTGPAHAQPQPSANAINMARELVAIIGATRDLDSIPTAVIVQVAGNYLHGNPSDKLYKDLGDIAEKLVEEYNPRRADMPNEVIRLYATRFSEQELKDLLTFYKSNIGKKMLSESQLILAEAARRAEAFAAKLREEIGPKIREELKKRGHNL
jgi:hypothetical protein